MTTNNPYEKEAIERAFASHYGKIGGQTLTTKSLERRRVTYYFEMVIGVVSILASAYGIYFVFRWANVMIGIDGDTVLQGSGLTLKRALLGETADDWIGNDETLLWVSSIFMGARLISLFYATARWQIYLREVRKILYRPKARTLRSPDLVLRSLEKLGKMGGYK